MGGGAKIEKIGTMQINGGDPGGQKVYTVSQITEKIKAILETNFPFIWITVEISNFSSPMSGHFYFSLKDENAQISAVMFRGQHRHLKFLPNDGMAVTGLGRISLYKPRGTYQVIFEYLEPQGIGALQVAFEQLKARLSDEGLFDEKRKKPLPFLPQKIALITSPTGAVLQDMLKIARRRFKNLHFIIVPVKVQGNGAARDIVQAIQLINKHGADIAIIARGGGSLEDLQAFNSESVARAIADSKIPIVSAVGHETDYTIADFIADYRAPTPSAAAEMVIPDKIHLAQQSAMLLKKLIFNIKLCGHQANTELYHISKRLVDPARQIQDMKLRCDDITDKMIRSFRTTIRRHREHMMWRFEKLNSVSPGNQLDKYREYIGYIHDRLKTNLRGHIQNLSSKHNTLSASLRTLSPLAVLDRGYSITRTIPEKIVITGQEQIQCGQLLEILLSRGNLVVSVDKKRKSVI